MTQIVGRLTLLLVLLAGSATVQAALPNVDVEGKPFPTLAPMLKQVNPAVVNISTFSRAETRSNPLLNDPFFRRFFDLPELQQPERQRPGSPVDSA